MDGKGYTNLLILGIVIMLALVGVAYGADYLLNMASTTANTVTAYYVPNATINEGNPGGETFWQSIPWSVVPLEPTVPVPGGISGHTKEVDMKAVWTYVDGVPYIFILMRAPVVGYQSWDACPETLPSGQAWQPFADDPSGWWVVNVSYTQNQSTASVYSLPINEQLQYPPGVAEANPVQIVVLNVNQTLVPEVLGATLPNGKPMNNGNPVVITSMRLDYDGTEITSPQQFLNMGLNGTYWAQDTYNLFYPEDTAGYDTLFYNQTFLYPERFVIMWLLGGVPESTWTQVAYTPHMMPGTTGALSAGEAELWTLNNNPRANNTQDSGYPGPTYFNQNPLPYYHYPQYKDPLNLGYLPHQGIIADLYTNGSSIYYIGGEPFIGFPYVNTPNVSPWQFNQLVEGYYNQSYSQELESKLWDPSVVATGFQFENTIQGPYMVAEFARTFSTVGVSGGQGESHYQIQLSPGHTYYVAFAVFQGGAGESVDFKSISFWWHLYIQPSDPKSQGFLPALLIYNAVGAPAALGVALNWGTITRQYVPKLSSYLRLDRFVRLLRRDMNEASSS